MATIAEIAARSQAYINNLPKNIDNAIYSVEQKLVEINRKQLLINKGGDDKPLINSRTGSEYLSFRYAMKTGKRKPDLFINGNFQDGMRLISNYSAKVYNVFSYHNLQKYLSVQYKNYPGIAPRNHKTAQEVTSEAIGSDYYKKVFK